MVLNVAKFQTTIEPIQRRSVELFSSAVRDLNRKPKIH